MSRQVQRVHLFDHGVEVIEETQVQLRVVRIVIVSAIRPLTWFCEVVLSG